VAEFEELVIPETKASIEETQLALAEADGLPVTAWGSSSVFRILFSIFATLLARLWFGISQVARGNVLETSTGAWLTLLARNYGEERLAPTFTVGTFKLTDAGGGPHGPLAVGAVTVAVGDLLYTNTASGTVPASGSLDLEFRATVAGAAHNVPNGSAVTLVTSLPTVTVANPAVGSTGTWVTTLGTDVESDAALRTRLSAKWASLSTGSPPAAYLYWALSTSGVTRAKLDDGNPDGPGTTRVYVDNASSVSALQASLDAKVPTGSVSTAMAATTQAVVISGIVTVERTVASIAEATADVTANLTDLAGEIDIGGTVVESEVIQRIMDDEGVVDFAMGSGWTGSPNVALPASAIPQFTLSLSYVEA
jgi:uncharacterized phage protein gp47/JayE